MFTKNKLIAYLELMRVNRPIGIMLLLYPTLWALWISTNGHPEGYVFVVFVLGVFVMRSAGCVINDYADRMLDSHVERTKNRPIVSGAVTTQEALWLFLALLLIAFILVLSLERNILGLAVIGALLSASYPFLKRYTHLPQFYLGAAFGWSIPMAYAAQGQPLSSDCWWLFAANVFWSAAYDTIYAMVDRDDDKKIGIKSTAILFGRYDRTAVFALHTLTLFCLWQVGNSVGLGFWFNLGLSVAAGIAAYQMLMINNREREQCFKAFLFNNWLGMAVFFGLVLDYTLV